MWLIIMADGPEICVLCQEPLLPVPVFWIDQYHDGFHVACEEQKLAEDEADRRGVGLI